MESISRMLFEDPLYIYVSLLLAELVLLALWRERRTPRAAMLLMIPPAIGAIMLMVSWLVVTDREQIVNATLAMAGDAVAGTQENLERYIDDDFQATIEGISVGKQAAIALVVSRRGSLEFTKVELTRHDVTLQGNSAIMQSVTVVFSGPKDKPPMRTPISWRFKWIKRGDTWRLLWADQPDVGLE